MFEDKPAFALYVSAITPARDHEGRVEFTFEIEGLRHSLTIDLPYYDSETIDAGVKQAARNLVILAETLAAEAKSLAE
jgi:hypothetical protein